MAFITAPTFNIRGIQWALDLPSQMNASPYSGVRRVVANPWHGKWTASAELPTLGATDALAWQAFLAKCRGQINTFKLPAYEIAQNSNSGVQVLTDAAQNASSITIAGAATAMLAGQRITVNDQLLQLTDVVGSTLYFEPKLREAANAGTSVETARPYALVHMGNSSVGWAVAPGRLHDIAFDVEEAVAERVVSNHALSLNFSAQQYYVSGTKYAAIASVPGYAFTRSGEQGAHKLDGTVAYHAANVPAINSLGYHSHAALTNLLLNAGSATNLVTQSVTVSAVPYTLAFIGTGTVTLSGVSTAGPLVGTGATTQVRLNFTPTAGTLTLTVSGTVQYAVLVAGTLGVPVPIIATAGATASIGASDLQVSDTVASGDQLFFARADFTNATTSGTKRLVFWFDGTTTNYVALQKEAAAIFAYAQASGVTAYSASATVAGDVTIVLRRLGGNWRGGYVQNGVLTWFGADTAGGFPVGIVTARIGHYAALDQPLCPMKGVFRTLGTFDTDAKVLAAVADAV